MERQTRTRRAPNRVRAGPTNKSLPNTRRRVRIIRRRNRQLVPRRNRLERAQNNRIRNGRTRMFRRPNNFNRRANFNRRTIFVGGLPRSINNRILLQLFRREGRIISYRVMRNRGGFSRGFGFVEFANPRDAWRSIQKWNNTTLGRNIIHVRYLRRRRINRRYNNNLNNRNNGRFNQPGRRFDFRGGRGGFRGGFRPRGRF